MTRKYSSKKLSVIALLLLLALWHSLFELSVWLGFGFARLQYLVRSFL